MSQLSNRSPLDEQTLLRLQGGLHGRFARSFSVLMGSVEALQRYLLRHTNGTVQDETQDLFESILEQIGILEHMTGNAVDLLSGTVLHTPQCLVPTDVAAFLRLYGEEANRELALQGAKARIAVDLPDGQPLYLPASEALLQALFMNLVTNSVHAKHDTLITVCCPAGGVLRYTDTGPGPGEEALELLRGGTVSMGLLRRGGLGLLVAVACAQDLGWQLQAAVPEGGGFRLDMGLPAPAQPPAAALFCSAAGQTAARARLRARLRRELELALQ